MTCYGLSFPQALRLPAALNLVLDSLQQGSQALRGVKVYWCEERFSVLRCMYTDDEDAMRV